MSRSPAAGRVPVGERKPTSAPAPTPTSSRTPAGSDSSRTTAWVAAPPRTASWTANCPDTTGRAGHHDARIRQRSLDDRRPGPGVGSATSRSTIPNSLAWSATNAFIAPIPEWCTWGTGSQHNRRATFDQGRRYTASNTGSRNAPASSSQSTNATWTRMPYTISSQSNPDGSLMKSGPSSSSTRIVSHGTLSSG
jgi:hypothetical protein